MNSGEINGVMPPIVSIWVYTVYSNFIRGIDRIRNFLKNCRCQLSTGPSGLEYIPMVCCVTYHHNNIGPNLLIIISGLTLSQSPLILNQFLRYVVWLLETGSIQIRSWEEYNYIFLSLFSFFFQNLFLYS